MLIISFDYLILNEHNLIHLFFQVSKLKFLGYLLLVHSIYFTLLVVEVGSYKLYS